nr:hypothetical protein [Tanacetum cinerariifolium]
TEEIFDKEHSNSSGSTAQVQPSVVPISIPEPDVLRTQTNPSITYPSRTNPHSGDPELADRSITRPKGVAEDVFAKVGKFHFPTDFVVVDFEADPRVPLILRRSFLRIGRALIDVYGEEITLREKYSVEEPPELELKELPSHLEYAFLEDFNKLPVIIAKNLKVEEKEALINTIEVSMDDFLVFGDSFSSCLTNLDKMLNRCEETNLVLNCKKCHFKCREGIVLGHKISKSGIEVDRAKVDVIAKLPHPTTVKGVSSFLGHAALKYLLNKQDAKPRLLRWVLLLQEFDITILDKKGSEKLAADHSSRLENPHQDVLENKDINENFPLETLGSLTSHNTPWEKYLREMRCLGTVEVKALPTNDARVVVKFLKSLFSRFGIPRAIISNRGTHICNDQFTRVMIKYRVTHRLATAYYPQTSGQVEVSNHGLKRILERTAYKNSVIYKERTKKVHDSKIKNRIFNVGDQVLLSNSRLKIFSGKLKTHWSGPFTITRVFPYGTIELSQPNGLNFKVNGHRVKHYFGGDIPSNVASDLHTIYPSLIEVSCGGLLSRSTRASHPLFEISLEKSISLISIV